MTVTPAREPFRSVTSAVVPMARNDIDTDQIIPARFLKTVNRAGLGDQLFFDWRYLADGSPNPEFVLNRPEMSGRQILVAGDNFGCGSSREHAPWALMAWGIRAVISSSFADIFRNNALKNGLLPIAVPPEELMRIGSILEAEPDAQITVDLETSELHLPDGSIIPFTIDAFARRMILDGTDELGLPAGTRAEPPGLRGVASAEDLHARLSRSGLRRGRQCLRMSTAKTNGKRSGTKLADDRVESTAGETGAPVRSIKNKVYLKELAKLQVELVKMQQWVKQAGLRVVLVFEGRDAAGKGGAIKTITLRLNPRFARVAALGTPTERERTQWYFQRYVEHLPAAGEMVLFDRSWYNRAGVERVMGFCTDDEYQEFLRSCPEFERMLVRSGIILVKYWFSVSDAEQERRFQSRIDDPTRRWKLSPMDLESRTRWVAYSKAKDAMFAHTDIKQAPWHVVTADNKKRARLNVIHHLLSVIPYQDLTPEQIVLPPREPDAGYVRPPMTDQTFIPEVY